MSTMSDSKLISSYFSMKGGARTSGFAAGSHICCYFGVEFRFSAVCCCLPQPRGRAPFDS